MTTTPTPSQFRILIVDDEEPMRRSLSRLLSIGGHEVSTASSGAEALEKIAQDSFELIILDLWMPGMNGVETLTRIRKIDHWVPVIAISAMGTEATIETCLKSGATAFLPKPFTSDDIDAMVQEAGAAGREQRDTVAAGAAKGWRGKLLIADDHAGFRTAVVRRLRLQGFDVDEAKNGQEAAQMSGARQYDALLLDIHMPEASGIEAGELVRARDPYLPIIFMSGEASDEEMHEGLSYSSAGCLRKPLDLDKLGRVLSFLMQTGRVSRRHVEAKKHFESLPLWKRTSWRAGTRLKRIRKDPATPRIALAMFMAVVISLMIMSLLDAGQRAKFGMELNPSDIPVVGEMYDEIRGYLQRDEDRELRREGR